jgi:DMSO/TMAO reductase YedYZ molybdopterin-dependent catalytic subunit
VEIVSDIHCVTHWSMLDSRWEGVHLREILQRVRVRPEAKAVLVHADPDYTSNVLLEDLMADDILLALRHNGQDLDCIPRGGRPERSGLRHPSRRPWRLGGSGNSNGRLTAKRRLG